jgi:preprotein translocase subunit SecY
LNVNFYFGGTSLLIVVGVAMDTINQVEAQLIMRHYEGFTPGQGGSGDGGVHFKGDVRSSAG